MTNIIQRVEFRVTGEWYKKLGSIALWYAGVSLAVWFVLIRLSLWTGESLNLYSPYFGPAATNIFMLVLGIVLPLMYYEQFIALGVTRKQLCRGALLAALLLSLSLAAFHTLINFINMLFGASKELFMDRISSLAADTIGLMVHFMLGWIIAAGFGRLRFLPAVLSLIACGFFSDMMNLINGGRSFWGNFINFLIKGAPIQYALASALFPGWDFTVNTIPLSASALGPFALNLPQPAVCALLVLLAIIIAVLIVKATAKQPVKS